MLSVRWRDVQPVKVHPFLSFLFSSLFSSSLAFGESVTDLFKRPRHRRDSRESGNREREEAPFGQRYGDEFGRGVVA